MEKRLNTKVTQYVVGFKNELKNKIMESGLDDAEQSNIIKFIYDYNGIVFTTDDFIKRKRVKNAVPLFERCCAKRACNEQCTRRKKEGFEYCGTHLKGVPNGSMAVDVDNTPLMQRVEVWGEDIMGITYYIDKNLNVYQTEDIIMNKHNPKIIAKYVLGPNGQYTIPEFDLV